MNSKQRKELRYQRRVQKRAIKKDQAREPYDDFDKIFSYGNLYEAYKVCRRNVAWKASVQSFISQAPLKVYELREKLISGKWKTKGFHEFDILERGKKRHIKSVAFEERIVQRCLCDNCLTPVLSSNLIYDNGATLPKKGPHFALKRCKKHLADHIRKFGREGYILLMDFKSYFETISHELVLKIIDAALSDKRTKKLIKALVDAFGKIGLGLGSQVSQILAVVFGNPLDHFSKEDLGISGYARYNDDIYLIHRSKEFLIECLEKIKEVCERLHLTINLKKTKIVKLSKGFKYLKCKFYITDSGKIVKKIDRRSITRSRRKLKKLKRFVDEGILTIDDVYQSCQGWMNHAKQFDSWETRTNYIKEYLKLRKDMQCITYS